MVSRANDLLIGVIADNGPDRKATSVLKGVVGTGQTFVTSWLVP